MNSRLICCIFSVCYLMMILAFLCHSTNSYEIACRHAYKGYSLSCNFNYLDDNKTLAADLPDDFAEFMKYLTHLTIGISNLTAIPSDTFKLLPNLHTLVSRSDIRILSKEHFLNATKLVMLNFGYNNQISKLESNLFEYVPTLEYIDLGYNNISKIEENAFDGLAQLKTLYLESNQIETLSNATFNGAHNLRLLELSRNRIREIENGTFTDLTKLRILQLNRNNIELVQANLFDGLLEIERIDLSINSIAEIEEGAFDNLPSLKLLELGFNQILTLPMFIFDDLPSLKTLFLASNRIEDIEYAFTNITQLKTLDLSHNPIKVMSLELLTGLVNLQSLELRGCNLTELEDGLFDEQKNLEILDLSENNLTSIDIMVMEPLDKLLVLKLEANRMIELSNYTQLKTLMPSLSFINLSRNEIDCDTVAEMIAYFQMNNIDYIWGEEVDVGCELLPFRSRNLQAYELSHAEFLSPNTFDKLNDNNLNMEQ